MARSETLSSSGSTARLSGMVSDNPAQAPSSPGTSPRRGLSFRSSLGNPASSHSRAS